MFCPKCGKEIADDAQFCAVCGARIGDAESLKAEEPSPETVFELKSDATEQVSAAAPTVADAEAKAYGRGGAITALVLGAIALISYLMCAVFAELGEIGATIFFLVAAIPFGIIAIVKGAKSIGAFKEMGRQNRARPVATLIMGIIGLALGAFSLLMVVIVFFTVVLLLSLLS